MASKLAVRGTCTRPDSGRNGFRKIEVLVGECAVSKTLKVSEVSRLKLSTMLLGSTKTGKNGKKRLLKQLRAAEAKRLESHRKSFIDTCGKALKLAGYPASIASGLASTGFDVANASASVSRRSANVRKVVDEVARAYDEVMEPERKRLAYLERKLSDQGHSGRGWKYAIFVAVAVLAVSAFYLKGKGAQGHTASQDALSPPPIVEPFERVPITKVEDSASNAVDALTGQIKDYGPAILVIGEDARNPGESYGRADALNVILLDKARNQVVLLTVPRDTRIQAGDSWVKINSRLRYGGPEGQVRAVEQLLGVKISGYVKADMESFKGVYTEIQRDLTAYFMDNNLPVPEYLRLDAEQMLAFLRDRNCSGVHGSGWDGNTRAQNQAQVIADFMRMAAGYYANDPAAAITLLYNVLGELDTSFSAPKLLSLSKDFKGAFGNRGPELFYLPGQDEYAKTQSGRGIWFYIPQSPEQGTFYDYMRQLKGSG